MPLPRSVPITRAPQEILALEVARRPPVVGITGPVGAGKSHLARLLSPCVLSTDDYLPDYDRVAYHERDDPAFSDQARLVSDLRSLREGRVTRVPVWSFQSHARAGERELTPPALPHPIVVEGIHALHDTLLPEIDIGVVVTASKAVRWQRWEHLESTGHRGWGVEVAREFFHDVAEPTFDRFFSLYLARAHLIVLNDDHAPPPAPP